MKTATQVFMELLEAWEADEERLFHEFSSDFDAAAKELEREKAEWIEKWNAAVDYTGPVVEIEGPEPMLMAAEPGTVIDVAGGSCPGRWLRMEDVMRGFTRVMEGFWVNLATGETMRYHEFLDADGIVFETAE